MGGLEGPPIPPTARTRPGPAVARLEIAWRPRGPRRAPIPRPLGRAPGPDVRYGLTVPCAPGAGRDPAARRGPADHHAPAARYGSPAAQCDPVPAAEVPGALADVAGPAQSAAGHAPGVP